MGAPIESGRSGGALSLEDVLRFGLSGTIVLLTVIWLTTDWFPLGAIPPSLANSTALVLAAGGALSFLLGAIVYSLHRALVHPIVERIILTVLLRGKDDIYHTKHVWSWKLFTPTPLELELVRNRWKRNKDEPHIQRYFHRWSSQTHFLHTIPQAYWIGCGIASLLARRVFPFDGLLFTASMAMFVFAGLDDFRLGSVELARIRGGKVDAREGTAGVEEGTGDADCGE